MDFFERLFRIEFEEVGQTSKAANGGPEPARAEYMVAPGETLQWQISVTFDNTSGALEQDVICFLCLVGETDIRPVWRALFETISFTPVLLPRSQTGNTPSEDRATAFTGSNPHAQAPEGGFEYGVLPLWLDGGCGAEAEGRMICDTVVVAGTDDAPLPAHDETGAATSEVPSRSTTCRYLRRTFHLDFIVPDTESGASMDWTLALVPSMVAPKKRADGGVCWEVLKQWYNAARAEVTAGPAGGPGALFQPCPTAIPIGCWYAALQVREVLHCHCISCPLSNDRLVLNLNITNNDCMQRAIVLNGVSFDLHATRTAVAQGLGDSGCLPSRAVMSSTVKRRSGPSGADMRVVHILNKIITVTPMVISDDKPPFVLQPDETYSFQFVLEVIPQLCYLLNPKSLKYVYERYDASGALLAGAVPATRGDTVSTAPSILSPSSAAVPAGAAALPPGMGIRREPFEEIKDCFGVSTAVDEIVSILSSTFCSHLFVYYYPARPKKTAPASHTSEEKTQQHAHKYQQQRQGVSGRRSGSTIVIHKQHPVTWSFIAS